MRILKKLLANITVSVLMLSALLCLLGGMGTAYATGVSPSVTSHAQSAIAALPDASGGGGCNESNTGYIGSCITINSSGYIVPNTYTSVAGSEVEIVLIRNGTAYSSYIWHGPVAPGHYIYPSSLQVPKSMTGTWVAVSDIIIGTTTIEVESPAQFT